MYLPTERTTIYNPAEAEDGFKVSTITKSIIAQQSFNPAEAEEGFRRTSCMVVHDWRNAFTIQPKPKNGLEEEEH